MECTQTAPCNINGSTDIIVPSMAGFNSSPAQTRKMRAQAHGTTREMQAQMNPPLSESSHPPSPPDNHQICTQQLRWQGHDLTVAHKEQYAPSPRRTRRGGRNRLETQITHDSQRYGQPPDTPEMLLAQDTTTWKTVNYRVNHKKALGKKMKAAERSETFSFKRAGEGLNVVCQAGFYELLRRAACQHFANFRTAGLTCQAHIQADQESAIVQLTFKIKTYGGQASYTLDLYHTNSSVRLSGRYPNKFIENDWPKITGIIIEMNEVRPLTEPEALNHNIKCCLEYILANISKPKQPNNNRTCNTNNIIDRREPHTTGNKTSHGERTLMMQDICDIPALTDVNLSNQTQIERQTSSNDTQTADNTPTNFMSLGHRRASPQQLRWQGSDPELCSSADIPRHADARVKTVKTPPPSYTRNMIPPERHCSPPMAPAGPRGPPQQLRWQGRDPELTNPAEVHQPAGLFPMTQASLFSPNLPQTERREAGLANTDPTAGEESTHMTIEQHLNAPMTTHYASTQGSQYAPPCRECHMLRMSLQAMEEEGRHLQRKIKSQEKALTQREKDLNMKASQHASAKTHITALENQIRQLQETNRLLHDRLAGLENQSRATPANPTASHTTSHTAPSSNTEDRLREMEKQLLELRLSNMEVKLDLMNRKESRNETGIPESGRSTPIQVNTNSQPNITFHQATYQ